MAAWTSDLQSHMIVTNVQDLVVCQGRGAAIVTLRLEGATKGSHRGVSFMSLFILGQDHKTVYGTSTC